METIGNIFVSSRIIYLILVPLIRELASILLAVAISKDCKARDNGSGILWGLFTLITPIFAGIIYAVYSRLLVDRKGETEQDFKNIKKSKKLTIWAILLYVVAVVIAIVCIITGAASAIAGMESDDGTNINSLMYDGYYDMNGIKYDEGSKVILYDKDGNSYHIEEDPEGWNYYPYFDEKGNSYSLEQCYISEDGYFYYDEDESLVPDSNGILDYEYDKIFYDKEGNKYKLIGEYAFFDKDGKIVINHLARHGTMNEYATFD